MLLIFVLEDVVSPAVLFVIVLGNETETDLMINLVLQYNIHKILLFQEIFFVFLKNLKNTRYILAAVVGDWERKIKDCVTHLTTLVFILYSTTVLLY